ncbi:recombination protein NinG [Vibrio sp. SCSIO 43136]|uniref:recombination protein NinG n=1 Tax=Vibrio sp. SCSIO 43136 TaxID=2819101 RepID=UPI002074C8A4|nr:recombination protein NinG [Vibrio sp. SCSIO 43136]USD64227.1 recombination protein NinG [Vibrio sp. SCSIO 43136]
MAKQPICKQCGKPFERTYRSTQQVCSIKCAREFGKAKVEKRNKREQVKVEREKRRNLKERKQALKTRTQWLDDLQKWVNKYVRLRDRNEPCCTCGTTNPNIKYDAGHFRTRGASPETRFELMNIHKQCSVKCNLHGSGMRLEYQEFLIAKYGQDKVDWLNGKHPSLKEQYPTIDSIKAEIAKFKAMCKELEQRYKEVA